VTVRYSDVQGGWPGLNNINADPLFFDSAAGNFRLRNECPVVSPCIDAGSDAAVPCDEFDLDDDDVFGCPASGGELLPWDRDKKTIFTNSHHGRILNVATGDGTEVDMGAYESQHITARRWDIAGNAGGPWPDFVVGTPDLLLLLQDWSVGGRTCSGCGADFDYSQFVDTVDFLVLLTNWCPPCPPPCVPMEGQGDSMASASGYSEFSESPVDGALAVMGFSSLDDYGAWLEQASPVQAYASGVVMAVLLGG
jgi:hypothetical protein